MFDAVADVCKCQNVVNDILAKTYFTHNLRSSVLEETSSGKQLQMGSV